MIHYFIFFTECQKTPLQPSIIYYVHQPQKTNKLLKLFHLIIMEDQKVSWEFVRDHVLKRLTDLEEEVRLLREVCWPVCQALSEYSQISNTSEKQNFLKQGGTRDTDEMIMLLKRKAKLYHVLQKQSGGLLSEEIARVVHK